MAVYSAPLTLRGFATILRMDRTLRFLLPLAVALTGCGGAETRQPTAEPETAQATVDTGAARPATPARKGTPREITFDDIKFDMEKGEPFTPDLLPKRVTALEESRIRIRGYILPSFQQTGLTQFVLVRDNMECCFGPGAALYDCIVVRMEPGKSADFSIRPVAVQGTFRLQELRGPDGNHLAIYAIDGEDVR